MSFARPTRFSALKDLDTDRVDGVDYPATRRKFLLFKREKKEERFPLRYTLGCVYSPNDGPDAHGDTMQHEDVRAAAWRALGRMVKVGAGLMHQPGTDGAGRVVESYIYRGPDWTLTDTTGKTQTIKDGDWMMGVVWEPEPWEAIKMGKIVGYSLQGVARQEPVDKSVHPKRTRREKAMTSFANVVFGVTPAVREYAIEDQPERDVQSEDDAQIREMNERMRAALESWSGKVEDGARDPQYPAANFPDGDSSRQRPQRRQPEYPEGGYAMLLEDEEADLNDRDQENFADPEAYVPRSAGARFPDPSNRVGAQIRKRGASVSFVDVIFGK